MFLSSGFDKHPYQQYLSINNQVFCRALTVISRSRPNLEVIYAKYFRTYHRSMPIVDKELFDSRLQDLYTSSNPHFSTLLLAMFLISELSPPTRQGGDSPEELYFAVKSNYSLLQCTRELSIELVQSGILIASYEHCQGLHEAAWLSIGTCARMGYALGLHKLLRKTLLEEEESGITSNIGRCVWWGIVILERYGPLLTRGN